MRNGKNMNKKILGVIVALIIIIVGCATVTIINQGKEKEDLVIWGWDPYSDVLEKAKTNYLANNPDCKYNIKIVEMGQEDMVERIKIYLSTGSMEQLPDIFIDEEYNFMEYMTYYQDKFTDLSDIISAEEYYDFKITNVTYNDKIYAMPFDSGTGALFYRSDIIAQAGYSDEDMNNLTWSKYIEIGKKVKATTGYDLVPINPAGDMEGRLMYYSAGTWFFDENGNANVSGNQAFNDSFLAMKSAYDADVVHQITSWDGYIDAIANSKVASIYGACWWAPIIQEYMEQSGKWKITQLPHIDGSEYSNYSVLGGSNWFVLNKDKQDVAKDFLRQEFAEDLEVANYAADEFLLVTTNISLANDLSGGEYPFYDGQNVVKLIVDFNSKTDSVHYGLHTYEITYYAGENVQKYLDGSISLDELINIIQKEAERVATK